MANLKPFKLHPDVKLGRNMRSISAPKLWDHEIVTDDMYKSQFVTHIEAQETLAAKILAGKTVDMNAPVDKSKRLTGTYQFSGLCERAVKGAIKPWIPMSMALGLNRRAQLAVTLQIAHSQLGLAKMSRNNYDMCVQILSRNLRVMGPIGSNLDMNVPKYSQSVVKHNSDAYKEIAAGNCKDPAEYIFFCCFFSYPLPGDGNRSVYSAFIAASVAMAFFATGGVEGPEFIREKHKAQLRLLELFVVDMP